MNEHRGQNGQEAEGSDAPAPHAVTPEVVCAVTEKVYKLLLSEIQRERERFARLPGDGGASARGWIR